ncbi:iron-sulfur cluster assembly scaffold protein [Candidatus Parcubacteria bacterium]|nr:iron-sulfur cluster assembly scaffold protein [Candidatus Parcubacteria bacterium]
MPYSQKVLEHFKNPRNQGSIENPDAVGEKGNPVCGDVMKMYLKIGRNRAEEGGRGLSAEEFIEDIKFETLGCAAAIAVSSVLTEIAKGKTLDEALKINKDNIVEDLGGLPALKIHCSMLGVDALRKAIKNYQLRITN